MEEPRWRRYLRFRGPDVDADIEDELQFHLDMRQRELVEEGRSPEQAREEAHVRFGDVRQVRQWLRKHDRSRLRAKQHGERLDGLWLDLGYGIRKLRLSPGFTAAIVAVLALGIGVTTAMFSAVDAVLLRPLPFPQSDRLVTIEPIDIPYDGVATYPKHTADILEVAEQGDVFTSVAAYAAGGMDLSGIGEPQRLRVGVVTSDFFQTLGVTPAIGRPFNAEDGRQGSARVVILSDALWRVAFGADPGVVGLDTELNGQTYRVIGVMQRGLGFPSSTQAWVPMTLPRTAADLEPFQKAIQSVVIGRLAPHVPISAAEQRIHELRTEYLSPEALSATSPEEYVTSLHSSLIGDRGKALLVLFGATALVLLVACANAATLLLSRASARRSEMAMRAVLGASRGRLVRQLLVESLMVTLLGGVLGLVAAWAGLGALERLVPATLSGAVMLRIDARVLLFAVGVVVFTAIAFGLWPAVGAPRNAERGMARMSGAGSGGAGGSARLRRIFVIGEVAAALMLLIGAGVMLRSLQVLLMKDPGVHTERVVTMEMSLARATYGGTPERQRFMRQVLERLESDPAIEAVALTDELPLRGEGTAFFLVEPAGASPAPADDRVYAQQMSITSGYFRAMGIPVQSGRSLSPAAEAPQGPREVVINEELATTFWPGAEAVGKLLVLPGISDPFGVVGVVGNVNAIRIDEEPEPQIYLPLLRGGTRYLTLVARGRLSERDLIGKMREAVQTASPGQAVYNVKTMEEIIADTIAPRRINTLLISLFGALAVVLAAIGVYGVIAHAVARRQREIGVRLALGAHPRRVVGAVLREGLQLTLLGSLLGLGGAWMLTRVMAGLVYGVAPRDPVAFLIATTVLIVVATLATLMPALRAATVDPAAIMKAE